jgi:hypothetical protein
MLVETPQEMLRSVALVDVHPLRSKACAIHTHVSVMELMRVQNSIGT